MQILKTNDRIYINCLNIKLQELICLKAVLCYLFELDYDQIGIIMKSQKADLKVVVFDHNKKESIIDDKLLIQLIELLHQNSIIQKDNISVETINKIQNVSVKNQKKEDKITDIGIPNISSRSIPIMTDKNVFVNQSIHIQGDTYQITCLSFQEPHTVVFVKDIDSFPLDKLGFNFESYYQFPQRTNVEFVEIIDFQTIKIRFWKKSIGEIIPSKQAIGASVVASVWNHYLKRNQEIQVICNNKEALVTYLENEHVLVKEKDSKYNNQKKYMKK